MPIDEYISSSKKWDWETPNDWFEFLDRLFDFSLDVAADPFNAKCKYYYTEKDNALSQSWKTENRWFCNPPWGNAYTRQTGYTMEDWISKAVLEYRYGNEGVMFAPMNCETGWWQDYVKTCPAVFFPRGRIEFGHPDLEGSSQPTKGTAIWLFIQKLTDDQVYSLYKKGWAVRTIDPYMRT